MLPRFFGIDNEGLNTVVKLLILVLVVVWLALVYFTYADARRRIDDPMLVGCATAASLFPFVGTVVYMIVRPPEYLEDVRERELEMQAAEARLHSLDYLLCPHCDHEVEKDFLRCPHCLRKLRDPCVSCGKPLDPDWRICPYCEAEIPGVTPRAPRRRRRRRVELGGDRGRGDERSRRGAAVDAVRPPTERFSPHGPDPHPGQAGRVRARPDRRDHRPLRAQGPAHRGAQALQIDQRELAEQHYAEHDERPFFGELVDFITSGPARRASCSRATRPSSPRAR